MNKADQSMRNHQGHCRDFALPAHFHAATRCFALILCSFLLLLGTAFAQKVRFYINSENISTDEALQLTMEVSDFRGSVSTPRWPNAKGLSAVGNSTQQSNINGRMSLAFTCTYVPQSAGTFTIPTFSYNLAGKAFNSPEFKVKVTKGSGRQQAQQQRSPFGSNPFDAMFGDMYGKRPSQDLKFQETKADYFLSINLDKDSCYVGEQVLGEVVLYINERDYGKINLDGRDIVDMQQRIKNTGFWQEIIEFEQVPMSRVQINGKNYIAYTLYQTILFPIKSGKIEFKGIDLSARKLYVATNANIMDAFMGKNQKFEPIRIKANERSLMVRALPPTELPEANVVGKFKMQAELAQSEANTGDNLELHVKISGNGNIAMMNLPTPNFPESFRNDGNSSDYTTKTTQSGLNGEKLYKYYLVPTRPGNFNLGPLKFYYFDPQKRQYDSIVAADLPVRVTGEDLADKLMRDRGMDSFYETNISRADASLRSDEDSPALFWVLGMGVIGVAVALRVLPLKRKG